MHDPVCSRLVRVLATPVLLLVLATLGIFCAVPPLAAESADQPPSGEQANADEAADVDIASKQEQIAEQYRRFELVLARLSETSELTDPQRASLLKRAHSQSKQQLLARELAEIVDLLESRDFSSAIERQEAIESRLEELLKLLLTEDREDRSRRQQEQIKALLKELGAILNRQKSLYGASAQAADPSQLAGDQGELAGDTGELARKVNDQESDAPADGSSAAGDASSPDEPDAGTPGESGLPGEPSGDGQSESDSDSQSDSTDGDPADRGTEQGDSGNGDRGEGDPQGAQGSGSQPQGDQSPQGSQGSQGSQNSQGSQGSQGTQGSQNGQPSQGSPQGTPSGDPDSSNKASPPPAAQALQNAQQRMWEAQEKLREAQREGALEKQEDAIRELEQAKAELERILRQMREEEIGRLLTMLDVRIRRMLTMQREVYEGTVRLDEIPSDQRSREDAIEAARLGTRESEIVLEADRTLLLLRDDGTAVAIPEALRQARADMRTVANRLSRADVGTITQAIEEDIIQALEEMLAAVAEAKEEHEQRQQDQQPMPPSMMPMAEQPLVDLIAEIRIIRSLQLRINRRSDLYVQRLEEASQEMSDDLRAALAELAERQAKVEQITQELGKQVQR